VNPCLRGSGVQRNPESKRERYVPHDEYRDVYACANRAVRLMMALTYRTLQRPESDIILWDRREGREGARRRPARAGVRAEQDRRTMVIAFSDRARRPGAADEVVTACTRREPLVRTLNGEFYTYDGLCGMLKKAIKAANVRRAREGWPRSVVRLPRPEGQGRHRYVAGRRADREDPGAARAREQDDHGNLCEAALARSGAAEHREDRMNLRAHVLNELDKLAREFEAAGRPNTVRAIRETAARIAAALQEASAPGTFQGPR
jgi:hypothetical protein